MALNDPVSPCLHSGLTKHRVKCTQKSYEPLGLFSLGAEVWSGKVRYCWPPESLWGVLLTPFLAEQMNGIVRPWSLVSLKDPKTDKGRIFRKKDSP